MLEAIKNEIAEKIATKDAFKWNFLADGPEFMNATIIERGIKNEIMEIAYIGMDIEYTTDEESEIMGKVREIVENMDAEQIKAELGIA